jgi:hypothetical protein
MLDPAGEALTGLGDKGLQDSRCGRLITPHKDDVIAEAVARIACPRARGRKEQSMRTDNSCLSAYRIRVECNIGDFTKWAAARGRTTVTIASCVDTAKDNIKLCVMLTNMIYKFRGLA